MRIDDDLKAAPATPLVLRVLFDDEGNGFEVLARVRRLADGELEWADGMLYPLLHRLHRLGYVSTDWRTVTSGRHRRYYRLTAIGRRMVESAIRGPKTRGARTTGGMARCQLHTGAARVYGFGRLSGAQAGQP